jgi:L-Ala-D/L-Glu epimerase
MLRASTPRFGASRSVRPPAPWLAPLVTVVPAAAATTLFVREGSGSQSVGSEGNETVKIERIEATPVRLPYRRPVRFGLGELTSAEHVVLRVYLEDGTVGLGEAVPRPMIYGETIASVMGAVETLIRPRLCGRDVQQGFDTQRRLRNIVGNNTLLGAIDVALWDAAARSLGTPLWKILGGDGGDIQVSGSIGLGDKDESVKTALDLAETFGLESFLIKVGEDLEHDMIVCQAIRTALPHVILHADANHGYMPSDAVKFAAFAQDIGISWIEEPVALGATGREWYQSKATVPTMTDETSPDLVSVARACMAGQCQIISLKIARTGITESLQISGLSEGLGIGLQVSTQGDSDVGTCASLQFIALGPQNRRYPSTIAYSPTVLGNQVTTVPLEVKGGRMMAPEGPGIGCDIDEEKLQQYAIL